jgi:uncharacterized protein YcfL
MKKGIACILTVLGVSLILVAGCTSSTTSSSATQTAARYDTVVLVNGTYAINASIEEITVFPSQSGNHVVNIYVNALNKGNTPIQLRWYSTITGANGVSYGGIGISHNGYGAETGVLRPGASETPRDYVVIGSDMDYQVLANGATLRVFFTTEPLNDEAPVTFSTAWNLVPSDFS